MTQGKIPSGKRHTMSIGLPQSLLFGDEEEQATLLGILVELQPLVDEGKVVHATYSEVVAAWKSTFGAEPNPFRLGEIDPQDYPCPR